MQIEVHRVGVGLEDLILAERLDDDLLDLLRQARLGRRADVDREVVQPGFRAVDPHVHADRGVGGVRGGFAERQVVQGSCHVFFLQYLSSAHNGRARKTISRGRNLSKNDHFLKSSF